MTTTAEAKHATDVDAKALETLNKLLLQYEGYESCRDMLGRVVKAKATLAETQAKHGAAVKRIEEATAQLAQVEGSCAKKQQELEASVASRKSTILAQLQTVQADLDRKQQDLAGWHVKTAQEVVAHERLIVELQDKLAQVQAEYQHVVSSLETARTQHATFVKSLAVAV